MKENNRECKIVQDLLPMYIEELTNRETNEFIEKHIRKCQECRQMLKDMNGEIKIEEINQDKEIKYLKKLNKKTKITIAIVALIIMIIACCIVGVVYNRSKMQVRNYTFLKASYVIENQEGTIDGNLYGTLLAVIDENGICKSVRAVEKGFCEDILKQRLEADKIGHNGKQRMNAKIEDDEIHYNWNLWNGYTIEQLQEEWLYLYSHISIEEI